MRILSLALKDLSQILRDRRSLLFLVAMPVVFTFFMGFAYGTSTNGNENTDPRIPLAVIDPEPEAQLNLALTDRLAASTAVRSLPMAETEAMEAFHRGEVAGVLLIPAGFDADVAAGETPQLSLIAEAASAEGQSLYQLLRRPVSQLFSAVETARIAAETRGEPGEYRPAFEAAWAGWEVYASESLVQVELAVAADAGPGDWTGGNPYNQASPGIVVMFAIFGLITSAQVLVQERKTRTLQRLMTTAMKGWEIVAGHMLAMFALTFGQIALLVVFGQLALEVDYLRTPLGTLAVAVGLGLWVASLGLLIGVVAKEDDQVILFSMIAMFLFSALGGTWFPLEVSGGLFSAIGRLTPGAWAMTGLQNLLIRGLDSSSAWLPAGMLAAYAAGFFILAVWRFRKMEV